MFIDVWQLHAAIPCRNFNLQPVGIGRVQNDMQACIQSFLEAFSLFLLFSVKKKKKIPLHLIVSCSKKKTLER